MPIPDKLFAVTNGDGVAEGREVLPDVTLVTFKDGTSKIEMIAAVGRAYRYNATLPDGKPNPDSLEDFFNTQIENFLSDLYTNDSVSTAARAAAIAANDAANQKLPPRKPNPSTLLAEVADIK